MLSVNKMEYYTTAEQEKALVLEYKRQIDKKQKEMDEEEKKTKKIQKYTARAHTFKPIRVFVVENGVVYLNEVKTENICPQSLEKDGDKYCLDEDFKEAITRFISKHQTYSVTFFPSGRYGPCVDYISKNRVFPARLDANGYSLQVEDEEKYDICVG